MTGISEEEEFNCLDIPEYFPRIDVKYVAIQKMVLCL